jgi:hypothetical protein
MIKVHYIWYLNGNIFVICKILPNKNYTIDNIPKIDIYNTPKLIKKINNENRNGNDNDNDNELLVICGYIDNIKIDKIVVEKIEIESLHYYNASKLIEKWTSKLIELDIPVYQYQRLNFNCWRIEYKNVDIYNLILAKYLLLIEYIDKIDNILIEINSNFNLVYDNYLNIDLNEYTDIIIVHNKTIINNLIKQKETRLNLNSHEFSDFYLNEEKWKWRNINNSNDDLFINMSTKSINTINRIINKIKIHKDINKDINNYIEQDLIICDFIEKKNDIKINKNKIKIKIEPNEPIEQNELNKSKQIAIKEAKQLYSKIQRKKAIKYGKKNILKRIRNI